MPAAVASPTGAIIGYAGKCADDFHSGTATGTIVDIFICNSTNAQVWTLNSSGELVNTASGLCLEDSGNGGSGTGQIMDTCTAASDQTWTYSSSGQFVLSSNGLCLTDPGSTTTNGTQLTISACGSSANEIWSQPGGSAPPPPTGAITGYAGKCADDFHSGTATGTIVDIFICNSTNAQVWTLNSSGELVNTASGLCLEDSGNGGSGTGQIMDTCTAASDQTWTYSSSGRYVLSSNGLCLADPGSATTNGPQLTISACGSYTSERWSPAGGSAPPPPAGAITDFAGKCADDFHSGTATGTIVDIFDCNGTNAQVWTLNSSGELVNTASGLCLEDSGNGGSGTGQIMDNCTAASDQTWAYNLSGQYVLASNGLCLTDPSSPAANGTQLDISACGSSAGEHWSPPGTPSVPTNLGFSPDHSGDAESLAPAFSASYSNSTGSSGDDHFQILDSSGTVVASGTGSTVSSGGTSTWTPGSDLQVGGSYKVESQAVFAGVFSAWSSPVSFFADPRLADGVHPWSTYIKVPLDKWTTAEANVASGGLQITAAGLSLPGAELPFSLNFWNNSALTGASGDPATIATGWTDTLSARLVTNADGSVTYFEPDGETGTFTPNGSGGYNSPGSVHATLAPVSGGGFTLTWHASGSTYTQGEVCTFNSSGQLTTEAAVSGEAIAIAYTSGQPTQVTDTEGRVIDLTYNSSADLTGVDDTASGRTWTIGYDSSGHLDSITNPATGVTSFTNASNGDVTAITSPAGRTVNIAYNSSGQVSTLTQAGTTTSPQWSFSYNSGTTHVTDPNGNVTTYAWDSAGRVTKATDALGQSKSTTWTPDNNVASATNASGNVTAFTWNATTDVLDKEILPTGAAASYTYGDTSDPFVPTQVTDLQGHSVSYSYDSYGQVTQATDGLSAQNTTAYAYQGVNGTSCAAQTGELCSVTNPDGDQTQYGYDPAGQLTSITPPSPLGSTSITYDPDGNPATVTDGRGDTTTYTWDSNGELIKAKPADASGSNTPQWNYDADGNLTKRSSSVSESFTWDALGRLATSTDSSGNTSTYIHDAEGNLTSLQDPAGTTSYTYNTVNEPASIADPWGGTTTLSYVSGNDTQLAKIAFPNGVSESFTYDNSGRITSLDAATSSTTLVSNTYGYATPAGADTALLQTGTDTAGDTTSYGYDILNRLTSATTKSSSGTTVSSYGYGYDGAGNMTSSTVNGTTTTYTHNAASELTSQGATYDAAGNLTGGAGFSSLAYDDAGQTTSITPSGGSAASLSYVDYTQNQLDTAGGTTFEPTAIGIAATVTKTATTSYAYTPAGGLLAENTGGSTYYYLLDPLGSVLGLTGSTGSLADQYTYSPYGQQTAVTNTVPNPFGYAGGLQVPGTSLIHYGARYYNPALGQWTQPDPTGQNPGYAYAGDNPVSNIDPTGDTCEALSGNLNICPTVVTAPSGGADFNPFSWTYNTVAVTYGLETALGIPPGISGACFNDVVGGLFGGGSGWVLAAMAITPEAGALTLAGALVSQAFGLYGFLVGAVGLSNGDCSSN